jgi:hypothetical protein
MKLIRENIEEVKYLTEATENGKKNLYITGPFLVYDKPNKNNRMYTKDILSNEVKRYNEEYVKTNRALGELGHPDTPSINLERVSHKIVELTDNGESFIGKALILDTPYGQIVKNFMDSGVNLGVSSRGMGSLQPTKEGYNIVQDDFRLATAADIVADPSAPDAFVNGIMEGVEWIFDPIKETWLEEKANNLAKQIHKMSKRQLEEQKLSIFENYIASLTVKNK